MSTPNHQAYINTKRLSVTEINTLVPQVFENAATATALWPRRNGDISLRNDPEISGIPITFFNKSWGVSCYKKQVSNLVQQTYPHQGHHELPCVGSKKLRTIRPRGSLVLGSLENPSLHRKHKGSLDSFTGSKLGTSKNGCFCQCGIPHNC